MLTPIGPVGNPNIAIPIQPISSFIPSTGFAGPLTHITTPHNTSTPSSSRIPHFSRNGLSAAKMQGEKFGITLILDTSIGRNGFEQAVGKGKIIHEVVAKIRDRILQQRLPGQGGQEGLGKGKARDSDLSEDGIDIQAAIIITSTQSHTPPSLSNQKYPILYWRQFLPLSSFQATLSGLGSYFSAETCTSHDGRSANWMDSAACGLTEWGIDDSDEAVERLVELIGTESWCQGPAGEGNDGNRNQVLLEGIVASLETFNRQDRRDGASIEHAARGSFNEASASTAARGDVGGDHGVQRRFLLILTGGDPPSQKPTDRNAYPKKSTRDERSAWVNGMEGGDCLQAPGNPINGLPSPSPSPEDGERQKSKLDDSTTVAGGKGKSPGNTALDTPGTALTVGSPSIVEAPSATSEQITCLIANNEERYDQATWSCLPAWLLEKQIGVLSLMFTSQAASAADLGGEAYNRDVLAALLDEMQRPQDGQPETEDLAVPQAAGITIRQGGLLRRRAPLQMSGVGNNVAQNKNSNGKRPISDVTSPFEEGLAKEAKRFKGDPVASKSDPDAQSVANPQMHNGRTGNGVPIHQAGNNAKGSLNNLTPAQIAHIKMAQINQKAMGNTGALPSPALASNVARAASERTQQAHLIESSQQNGSSLTSMPLSLVQVQIPPDSTGGEIPLRIEKASEDAVGNAGSSQRATDAFVVWRGTLFSAAIPGFDVPAVMAVTMKGVAQSLYKSELWPLSGTSMRPEIRKLNMKAVSAFASSSKCPAVEFQIERMGLMDREAIDSATASLDRFAFKLWKTGLMLICHFGVGGMVVIPHKTSTPPNVVKLLGLCSPDQPIPDALGEKMANQPTAASVAVSQSVAAHQPSAPPPTVSAPPPSQPVPPIAPVQPGAAPPQASMPIATTKPRPMLSPDAVLRACQKYLASSGIDSSNMTIETMIKLVQQLQQGSGTRPASTVQQRQQT